MKKYLTIDVLKKLMFPVIIITSASCATVGFTPKPDEGPSIVEHVRYVSEFKPNRFITSTWNYFDVQVTKVVEIRNPLSFPVQFTYTCDSPLFETVLVPPHRYAQTFYVTNTFDMYKNRCFVKSWEIKEAQ